MAPKTVPGNPLWIRWLEEMRDLAAQRGNDNSVTNCNKAIASLKACPTPMCSPWEATALRDIGKTYAKHLEQRLKDYCQANEVPFPEQRSGIPCPPPGLRWNSIAHKRTATNANVQIAPAREEVPDWSADSDASAGPGSSLLNRIPQGRSRKASGKRVAKARAKSREDDADGPPPTKRSRARVYTPKHRSGAYAILLALYALCDSEEHLESATRPDIEELATPLCDSSFAKPTQASRDEGGFYNAWSSMAGLIKKDLATKDGKSRWALTLAGYALAKRMRAVEDGLAAPAPAPAPAPVPAPVSASVADTPLPVSTHMAAPVSSLPALLSSEGSTASVTTEYPYTAPSRDGRRAALGHTAAIYKPVDALHKSASVLSERPFAYDYIDSNRNPVGLRDDAEIKQDEQPPHQTLYHIRYWVGQALHGIVRQHVQRDKDRPVMQHPDLGSLEFGWLSAKVALPKSVGLSRQDGSKQLASAPAASVTPALRFPTSAGQAKDSSEARRALLQGPSALKRSSSGPATVPSSRVQTQDMMAARSAAAALARQSSASGLSSTSFSKIPIAAGQWLVLDPIASQATIPQKVPNAANDTPRRAMRMTDRSTGELPTFEPLRLRRGTFDIVVIVDSREVSRSQRGEAVAGLLDAKLSAHGIQAECRTLDVGDCLWIARDRSDSRREFVLDCILERKTTSDFMESIAQTRYLDQKLRMKASGISSIFYLVSNRLPHSEHNSSLMKGVRTSKSQLGIVDDFQVINVYKEADVLQRLTEISIALKRQYQEADLLAIPDASVHRESYLELQRYLRRTQPDQKYLTTYTAFRKLNAAQCSLASTWAGMLYCVTGLTHEKISRFLDRFPTPLSLRQELRRRGSGDAEYGSKTKKPKRGDWLNDEVGGNCVRSLGPLISGQCSHQIPCDSDLADRYATDSSGSSAICQFDGYRPFSFRSISSSALRGLSKSTHAELRPLKYAEYGTGGLFKGDRTIRLILPVALAALRLVSEIAICPLRARRSRP
ncbi:uncharacterized protein L969DRAFT_93931 [Mixia osmundae IAM 14324]|uniref:Crossover junction endonuclease MUS81 n=1 Tax=Mixia osmundae (strain CBS 9802 / IAM 14324 / JCM 22182 / KY 12970) TaxID=764103 RepID=G7EA02_MIXOS|nr:uncharacterized protein L969DRAFT_93931 [Mixia osmundae IAM 14324]KEI40105.1 hypothetical protein L969DRAFT_93931 [Mixia osmundae IAM 14324]GAA99471.1 hypothetical protein E5Q_06170 [Mixia osmundae IAM 14324]